MFLQGFGVYRRYFAQAIDKLGIQIHVFRVGKYKSFVEPFIRNDMSPAARAANRTWLGSLWQNYVQGVGTARELAPAEVKAYVQGFPGALAKADGMASKVAVDAGLVDALATPVQVRDRLAKRVGTDPELGAFRQIGYRNYLRATDKAASRARTDSTIGLVVVEGPIVMGEGVRGSAGGQTIASLVRRARRDESVAALVLRINSPGGAVFAAERIRRQVALTRAAGKPVVVSMAGMAASGGYWIGMNANQIWAQPSTITGSIGVFGVFPTIGKSLDKIGINTDGLGTTPLSGALRLDMPMSPQVEQMLQSGVEFIYQRFIAKVAEARGMDVAAVNEIAQGRVWSGVDAEHLGLVDKLGGLKPALASAAALAGLQPGDYRVENIQPPTDWRAVVLQMLSVHAELPVVSRLLSAAGPMAVWLRHGLHDPRSAYAFCFCRLSPSL
ncbi:MAG: signal peptide peptidase SppA [Salinisphaera sp.]|nr:signal peptide peptidase SppA [Salinisphaera sp.]